MLASLVIPTRNRARVLERTLAALTGQRGPAFEVVVVDDGSEDATPDVARAYRDRLDLRYLRRAPRGIAAARTAAMRAAKGDILIQTDDDRVPTPTFVAEHVAAHADGPRVVAGQQRGLLAAWAPAAELPATAIAAVLARTPALAATLAAGPAELVTPAMLAEDLDATLARYATDEPWWQGHGVPLTARYGVDLDGYAFPWAVAIGGNTGFDRLWGVGYWGTRVFGFSERGDLTVIDRATGAGTLVAGGGETWWGAAVTTAAPIVD